MGGALDAAAGVGGDAVGKVRKALLGSAALPRDVIESAIKGHDDNKEIAPIISRKTKGFYVGILRS
ncbi:MAG TPA: hypothetical protein VFT87_05795 [Candidatus Saccharimonadales bacterium]|nr:hypothetical protein [Candidatus Saccharimonadales bacterium]